MEKKTFYIPNISCGHCINTIKNELKDLKGISRVEGNSDKKEIAVEYDSPASIDIIKNTLAEINYPSKD